MAMESSFDKLMLDIKGAQYIIPTEIIAILESAAEKVKETAKQKFGEYQPAYGPFNAWQELNYDYVVDKMSAGAPGDEPLIGYYMSGSNSVYPRPLNTTLETKVDKVNFEAVVGTNDPLGLWHEYGDSQYNVNYPPRPFLRPALYQNTDWIVGELNRSIGGGLKSWFE